MNIGFEKMKLSEIAKLLEDNKILKFVTDNNDSAEKPIKIKMKDSIIYYYDAGEKKYSPLEIPLVDFQLFYFKPVKTIKEQICEILVTDRFTLSKIENYSLVIYKGGGEPERITFAGGGYYIEGKGDTYIYKKGILDALHTILENNNHSFIEN